MNPGTVLAERFEIVRALARGGMADLFVGQDLETGDRVAIKVLREDLSKNAEAIARFHREAEIASRLVSPHVAKIYEFGITTKDWPFLVMELLEGHDLGTELRERGALPPGEAASYVAQACLALIEAHDGGIVHRDLKPSNLFLAEDGSKRQLKVLDFGIAKLARQSPEELTRATAIFGSPIYMSPEAFRTAKESDERSDIWSLGVILYEMLAGVPPFQGADPLSVGLAVTRDELVPLSRHVAGVPPLLQQIVSRTLMKDPQERFQTMRELLSAIEPFVPRAPLDTPTREHVVPSRPPLVQEAREVDNHETLLKVPSIAPPSATRSSTPPPHSSAPPSGARSSAPPSRPRSSAPPAQSSERGETSVSEAVPGRVWKLPRADERDSDAANATLSSGPPPPPPPASLGAMAKLALMGAVLGVAALAGWLAFVDVPASSGEGRTVTPSNGSPTSVVVQATSDSDQPPRPELPVAALPAASPISQSAAPIPLEDLPLAASSTRASPHVIVRPRQSAKPGKVYNPTEI